MRRRGFIVGAAAATVALGSALAAGGVTVIYIGGRDCGPCQAWQRNQKPAWMASRDYARVRYVEIEAPRLREAYQPRYWPQEWLWALDQLPQKRGTPRFLVIKDRTIRANQLGTNRWRDVLEVARRNA
jgi:hypothetical protein